MTFASHSQWFWNADFYSQTFFSTASKGRCSEEEAEHLFETENVQHFLYRKGEVLLKARFLTGLELIREVNCWFVEGGIRSSIVFSFVVSRTRDFLSDFGFFFSVDFRRGRGFSCFFLYILSYQGKKYTCVSSCTIYVSKKLRKWRKSTTCSEICCSKEFFVFDFCLCSVQIGLV